MKCELCGKESKKRLCVKHWVQVRRYRFKIAAIMYLGGKCLKCGDNNIAVLEFHHCDDKNGKKEFTIGNQINISWERIKRELDKCILLCHTCHTKEHRGQLTNKFLKIVFDYKGATKINEVATFLNIYKKQIMKGR